MLLEKSVSVVFGARTIGGSVYRAIICLRDVLSVFEKVGQKYTYLLMFKWIFYAKYRY